MILFPNIRECCDCNACEQICPKGAISSSSDKDGYIYPGIDQEKCINCGLCQKVCAYQHISETDTPRQVFAAVSKNKEQLKKSASGGIFASVATKFLSEGGVVFGAALSRKDNKFVVAHRKVESMDELPLLQGSKYLLSNIGSCFREIRALLIGGRKVLFSGTPCQCAGLKGFLGKDYDNLFIIDIICHGVPNQQFFNNFIDFQYPNLEGISNFAFRDKTKGWELTGRIDYENGKKSKFIPAGLSSYYSLFLDGQIYRENCYSCKYASRNRPGDWTIGDYWGIQKQHPELTKSKDFSIKGGVSCIIVNSGKGEKLIEEVDNIALHPSTYEQVAARNEQLLRPMKMGRFRPEIMKIYESEGYKGVNRFYLEHYKKTRFIHSILACMPYRMKNILRNLKH